MLRSCLRVLLLLSANAMLVKPGYADYLLTLNLNPNVYTVTAGNQITLTGFFTTSDSLSFAYQDDLLFGLNPTSPHLGIVAGSVLFSQNINPPVSGAYFEDIFGGGGYLGPTPVNGPTVTSVSFLRTFVIPANTQLGAYDYSYGVDFFPPPGQSGSVLFDRSLVINVVSPEPASIFLVTSALGVLITLRGRRSRRGKQPRPVSHSLP